MSSDYTNHPAMTLFSIKGERKYLSKAECKRFVSALRVLKEQSERLFCETVYATGCRVSEALQLDIMRVNVEDNYLIFRSLKKHGGKKNREYRVVPIKPCLAKKLNRTFNIVQTQRNRFADQTRRLWSFGRQKAWLLIKAVMDAAQIFGIRASGKGLRHSYGVTNILAGTPVTVLQDWLGHSELSTTAIYLKVMGIEDRSFAKRHWAYLDS